MSERVRFARSTPHGYAQAQVGRSPANAADLRRLRALLQAAVDAGVSFDADDFADAKKRCAGAVKDLAARAASLREEADRASSASLALSLAVEETGE